MTRLKYPDLPVHFTHRAHFLEGTSFRRDRASALVRYADASSRQTAENGDAFVSIAVAPERVQFFERFVEAIGADGLTMPFGRKGGFYAIPPSSEEVRDPNSEWSRINQDNFQARLYHWSLRRGQLDSSIRLPTDFPDIPASLPWDPDPRYQSLLDLTSRGDLRAALELVEQIPAEERESVFDEVLYLRYLVGAAPRGSDLRYLARTYVRSSAIRSRLETEFHSFIDYLDVALSEAGPLPDKFPGLSSTAFITNDDPDPLRRATPPLKDWVATMEHYFLQLAAYGHPVRPRGRIFVWNPDIVAQSLASWHRAFQPEFVSAENAFRRARSIAEIGKGWASEASLFDLIKSVCPDAVHQWRPFFLGAQSVDIFVPSLNLAVEYQGAQHYQPVALFGGQEGFDATQARDNRKRHLLAVNKVVLVEWSFERPIVPVEVEKMLVALGHMQFTSSEDMAGLGTGIREAKKMGSRRNPKPIEV